MLETLATTSQKGFSKHRWYPIAIRKPRIPKGRQIWRLGWSGYHCFIGGGQFLGLKPGQCLVRCKLFVSMFTVCRPTTSFLTGSSIHHLGISSHGLVPSPQPEASSMEPTLITYNSLIACAGPWQKAAEILQLMSGLRNFDRG